MNSVPLIYNGGLCGDRLEGFLSADMCQLTGLWYFRRSFCWCRPCLFWTLCSLVLAAVSILCLVNFMRCRTAAAVPVAGRSGAIETGQEVEKIVLSPCNCYPYLAC